MVLNNLKKIILNFLFLPITNNEILNVADSMKSKNSKDINNYNMYLIK